MRPTGPTTAPPRRLAVVIVVWAVGRVRNVPKFVSNADARRVRRDISRIDKEYVSTLFVCMT
jgi:hypothetical protein